jgi:hypothetical protein
LNLHVATFGLSLKNCWRIPRDRLSNGTKDKTSSFFEEFQQRLQSFPPELVFGADETMVNINRKYKAVTEERMAISVEAFENQLPHIRVMRTHSAAGAMVSPFVILPQLQEPTANVLVIMEHFKAWVGSSAQGWQSCRLFLASLSIGGARSAAPIERRGISNFQVAVFFKSRFSPQI